MVPSSVELRRRLKQSEPWLSPNEWAGIVSLLEILEEISFNALIVEEPQFDSTPSSRLWADVWWRAEMAQLHNPTFARNF